MQQGSQINLKAAGVVALAVAAAVLWGPRLWHNDVQVCQRVFAGLVRGDEGIHDAIDWEHLSAMGVEAGKTFAALPNDWERTRYKQMFIAGFAKGFAENGAKASDFTGWRVRERNGEQTLVAADYASKGKTLLLGLSHAGGGKLTSIQWQ